MAIDATVGGAAANSYVTLTVAQSYFDARLETEAWDDATEEQQEAALVMAALRLEQEPWVGCEVTSTQALRWPRYGATKRNGWAYLSTEVPVDVQNAQCELALGFLSDSTLFGNDDIGQFQQVTIGTLSVTPLRGRAGAIPQPIRRTLAYLLAAGMMTPIVRG